MNVFNRLLKPRRLGVFLRQPYPVTQLRKVVFVRPSIDDLSGFLVRNMSQKSITSFFKATPKKTTEEKEESKIESPDSNGSLSSTDKSPKANGKDKKKRSSKRQRVVSSDDECLSPKPAKRKSSPISSEKKTESKRQRIESSESETESPKSPKVEPETPNKQNIDEEEMIEVKVEKTPKTYNSPKNKKAKMKAEKSVKKSPLVEKNKKSPPVKEEKKSPDKSKTPAKVKNEKPPAQKKVVSLNSFFKKENEVEKIKKEGVVSEEEYNPAKSKYHPIDDACWSEGEAVPYLALTKTMEVIEATSARLKIVEILSNYFRSVIALTPEDLLPSVYLCLNQLAPAYHSLELGIAETYLMKAIGQCTGRTLAQMKAAAQKAGDLGAVAEQARATQRTMFAPAPLTVRAVYTALTDVARMTGQASVNKKIAKIQSLYIACRHSEARYLIRSLEGKLRIGLAEQSVLQALAVATTLTPPGPPPPAPTRPPCEGLSAEQIKAKIDEQALVIKTTYCECPNYDMLIPAMLQHGVAALPAHCKLTPGIPLKPMLAHPTKGLHEVLNRFEKQQFTCEWKYDGERAQIHVPETDTDTGAGACAGAGAARIFSRSQEDTTSKFPDLLRRLPKLLKESVTSCVLDTEVVAYDVEKKQILPFQILSTRKRKEAVEEEIKVQVCVFLFDLLYLNGRALVAEPLLTRRALLREHFHEVEGEWQFARGKDCSSLEEVEQCLEESVAGSCEGLMVKTLTGDNARYDIARRSHNWLKLKKDYLEGVGDSIDAVVVGGWWGRGRRAGVLGGFLLACVEGEGGEQLQTLCKIGTGFSDDDLKTLTEQLRRHVIDGPKSYYRYDVSHTPDVWVEARCVWEVRCADLSLSPAHRAAIGLVDPDKGISLRFPRFVRVREDKTPEQATSAQQIAQMYLAQDQVKNTANTKTTNLDDFY